MADAKALIEHIARRHWEYGQGGQWEIPEGVNPADQPFPAYADDQQKNQYRAYAAQLLAGSPILQQMEELDQLLAWTQDLATDPLHSMTETSSLAEEFSSRLKKILGGSE